MTSRRYVLDQNMMRGQELRDILDSELDVLFVVPDVAFVEMCKSENWEGTMRPSFAAFAGRAQRLVISQAVGDVLARERASLKPIASDELVVRDLTIQARVLVDELGATAPGPSIASLRARYKDLRADLKAKDLDAEAAKARTVKIAKPLRGLKSEVLKALRKDTHPGFRRSFIALKAEIILEENVLVKSSASQQAKARFAAEKSFTRRYLILQVRHALDWVVEGGLDSIPADRELNNLLDMEYAVTASYFDAFWSKDGGAKDAYDDLKAILDAPDGQHAAVVEEALASILPSARAG